MDINSVQNYYRIQSAVGTGRVSRPNAETAPAEVERSRTDKIDISSEASFKAQLSAYAKSYSAQSNQTASNERISQLKRQYQGDACPVSGRDIASAVMQYTLGAAVSVK